MEGSARTPVEKVALQTVQRRHGLKRRPRALTPSVEDLVQDILDGKVRVPRWQRGLQWDAEDVRKLIDSLYHGYPIGTLLFWQREATPERLSFGALEVDAPARSDAWWVIDGQQRLTSLVRVLASESPDSEFALYFNLAEGVFEHPPRGEVPESWLPLTAVLDSRQLLRWLKDHPEADADPAFELSKRLREYQVPVYVVHTDKESVAREVFERTNNTGKSLGVSDVFDGRFRGRSDVEPAGLRDVAEQLEALGFGRLDEDLLHGMMLATQSTDLSKADTSDWTEHDARAALDVTQRAGKETIRFLMNDADIPHRSMLPYTLPLPTLCRLFALHPELAPRNRELVRRWLWRGSAAELLGGATVRTRATLEAIQPGDEDDAVQRLLQTVEEGRVVAFQPRGDRFNSGHAVSRVVALALWSLEPRHLQSGARLPADIIESRAIIGRHAVQGSAGNRMLHPRVAGGLRSAILNCRDEDVLKSHLIDRTLVAALEAGELGTFITRRQRAIEALSKRFVAEQTRWQDSDRPPLRAFWDDDEAA